MEENYYEVIAPARNIREDQEDLVREIDEFAKNKGIKVKHVFMIDTKEVELSLNSPNHIGPTIPEYLIPHYINSQNKNN